MNAPDPDLRPVARILHRPPYVWLDGDDRSGSNAVGENLFVNLDHASQVRRVLVFAYIYERRACIRPGRRRRHALPGRHPQIEVRLDEQAGKARTCAVALLENNGTGLQVRREVRYINGSQADLDRAYGWGMKWTPGRK